MTDQDKLRVMLGHWIAHNQEHAAEFLRWADRAGEAAEDIRSAAQGMQDSGRHLAAALQRLGGPLSVQADRAGGGPYLKGGSGEQGGSGEHGGGHKHAHGH